MHHAKRHAVAPDGSTYAAPAGSERCSTICTYTRAETLTFISERLSRSPGRGIPMWPFDNLKVRSKLTLLVGVPVLGALLLSGFIALDARQRATSAAALGSITDLAELSARMNHVVQALQRERAETALSVGTRTTDTAKPNPA